MTTGDLEILQVRASLGRHHIKGGVVETGLFKLGIFKFGTIGDQLSDAVLAKTCPSSNANVGKLGAIVCNEVNAIFADARELQMMQVGVVVYYAFQNW